MVRALQLCPQKTAHMLTVIDSVMAAIRPDRCTILRSVRFSDDAGGFVETFEPDETNIPCRVKSQGMQPWERIDRIGDRITSTNVFLISMPAHTDIRPTDRIRVDTLGTSYEVLGSDGPSSFETERTAQCVLIT